MEKKYSIKKLGYGMDMQLHPTIYQVCYYLSMLRLKCSSEQGAIWTDDGLRRNRWSLEMDK